MSIRDKSHVCCGNFRFHFDSFHSNSNWEHNDKRYLGVKWTFRCLCHTSRQMLRSDSIILLTTNPMFYFFNQQIFLNHMNTWEISTLTSALEILNNVLHSATEMLHRMMSHHAFNHRIAKIKSAVNTLKYYENEHIEREHAQWLKTCQMNCITIQKLNYKRKKFLTCETYETRWMSQVQS